MQAAPPSVAQVITTTKEFEDIKYVATRIRLEYPEKLAAVNVKDAVNAVFQECSATLSELEAEVDKSYNPPHLQGTVVIVNFKNIQTRKDTYDKLAPYDPISKTRASVVKREDKTVAVKLLRTAKEQAEVNLLFAGKKKLENQSTTNEKFTVDMKTKELKDARGDVRAVVEGDSLVVKSA